ncbi:unnamed protein product [Spirodela intermedia]|uniref:protein-serine/threonine phosphatase n=1 Tax=Spirodela intermedia TaxID=51605 RepID=A0A7I8JPS4_SPIIN|nr:unnamed protein product [Spirodela intermedia]CAA6671563.1 unnamed protein product [Spirodela intermedia]
METEGASTMRSRPSTGSTRRRRAVSSLSIRGRSGNGGDGEDFSESATEPGSSFESWSSSSSSSSLSSSSATSPKSDSDRTRLAAEAGPGDAVPCVSHGSVSVIGRRREMEDAVTLAPAFLSLGGPRYDFFGVFDGHGGASMETRSVVSEMEWREAMETCFLKVDEEVTARAITGGGRVACIMVANCGDSRAVLSRGGVPVPLSSDHKPGRPDERERVEAAGGRVFDWGGLRVCGVLATSRSIGDHYLKPYVIPDPEVTVTARTEADEFLILGSDGLWDVVPNELACAAAAALLVKLAIFRGSADNVTAVVVELPPPPADATRRLLVGSD